MAGISIPADITIRGRNHSECAENVYNARCVNWRTHYYGQSFSRNGNVSPSHLAGVWSLSYKWWIGINWRSIGHWRRQKSVTRLTAKIAHLRADIDNAVRLTVALEDNILIHKSPSNHSSESRSV